MKPILIVCILHVCVSVYVCKRLYVCTLLSLWVNKFCLTYFVYWERFLMRRISPIHQANRARHMELQKKTTKDKAFGNRPTSTNMAKSKKLCEDEEWKSPHLGTTRKSHSRKRNLVSSSLRIIWGHSAAKINLGNVLYEGMPAHFRCPSYTLFYPNWEWRSWSVSVLTLGWEHLRENSLWWKFFNNRFDIALNPFYIDKE